MARALEVPADRLADWLVQDRTLLMAVLNMTPDSFSDGGRFYQLPEQQVHNQIDELLETVQTYHDLGVDILDVGGESTRPGAEEVPVAEEARRVVPVIGALSKLFPEAVISVDTRKSEVARQAMDQGATIINDVSGLRHDPDMTRVAAETGAYLVIMHSVGTPETMQHEARYDDVVAEVRDFLAQQAARAEAEGVLRQRILLDPGFGFGKRLEHNYALMRHLDQITDLGYPVLAGTSRKSFLAMGREELPPEEREALTAATLSLAVAGGARVVRVHDPKIHLPVVRLSDAIMRQ